MSWRTAIKRWYYGTTVNIDAKLNTRPDSPLIFMGHTRTTYHWTARIARAVVSFYLRHWQFLWTIAVAVATLLAAVAALK